MEYKDYYQTLGLSRGASDKDIKQAYRRLARQYHPDVNPGNQSSQEKFKEINEAYEVLSDPAKRQKYDQLGAQWQNWQRMGFDPSGFNWNQWFAGPGTRTRMEYADLGDLFGGESPFSDFFQAIFGRPGRTRTWSTVRRGQDLEQTLEISLMEAFSGTTRTLQISDKRIEVRIPPGVKIGSRIRVAGKGSPGVGGAPAGDLYLRVNVAPDHRFQRQGDDLHQEVGVDLYTAVLGGEIPVPTLRGSVILKIPPQTQGGKVFRLQGQGMPNLKNHEKRGDLFVKVKIRIPENLGEEEKELFARLAKIRRG
ncbi:MAG: DnaJ domain-containing protein [Chloroflexi bacterium]|nr:DnaJ domain-containing protein [Chloroflexota bacterium]